MHQFLSNFTAGSGLLFFLIFSILRKPFYIVPNPLERPLIIYDTKPLSWPKQSSISVIDVPSTPTINKSTLTWIGPAATLVSKYGTPAYIEIAHTGRAADVFLSQLIWGTEHPTYFPAIDAHAFKLLCALNDARPLKLPYPIYVHDQQQTN